MADEEVAPEEEEGEGGGKKKIIIIAVVLLLVIGGAAAFFLTQGGDKEEEEEEVVISSSEPLANPVFLDLGTFIANLKEGRRYLKAKVQLMISEEAAVEYLTIRLVEVKDIVLAEMQQLSIDEIRKAEQKEALKQRLISKVSRLFPTKPAWEDQEPIKKVLFEEFYIQ